MSESGPRLVLRLAGIPPAHLDACAELFDRFGASRLASAPAFARIAGQLRGEVALRGLFGPVSSARTVVLLPELLLLSPAVLAMFSAFFIKAARASSRPGVAQLFEDVAGALTAGARLR
jgi:hypothetical protein